MGKRVTIFTNTFPYGLGETFFNEELPFLCKKFGKVDIFPLYIPGTEVAKSRRDTPDNTIIHPPLLGFDHKDKKGLILNGAFTFAPLWFAVKEFLKRGVYLSGKKLWIWGNYTFILRSILGNVKVMEDILDTLAKSDTAYFYWGDKSALLVPFLKRLLKGRRVPKFVVRFHGSDLYEEAKGFLPYREMLYKAVDYAVAISHNGKGYIEKNYRNQPANISVHHLGSFYHSDACPNLGAPVDNTGERVDTQGAFNIISCSNVIELKRVHLIAAAMLTLERDSALAATLKENGISHLCWTHIGDGPLLEPIKDFIVENGVESEPQSELTPVAFNFLGAMPHSQVMEYYQSHYTDLFVQVSRTEGIPVSIMEALSFGTPVIATNVGGVAELIPDGCKCGTLLDKNLTTQQLADAIKGWILKSIELPEFETALTARHLWEENWNCEKNYTQFAEFLISTTL